MLVSFASEENSTEGRQPASYRPFMFRVEKYFKWSCSKNRRYTGECNLFWLGVKAESQKGSRAVGSELHLAGSTDFSRYGVWTNRILLGTEVTSITWDTFRDSWD